MTVTAKCEACGRKTLRLDASTVATTVHTRTCRCGARYRLVVRPVMATREMTMHLVEGTPLPPRPPRRMP